MCFLLSIGDLHAGDSIEAEPTFTGWEELVDHTTPSVWLQQTADSEMEPGGGGGGSDTGTQI